MSAGRSSARQTAATTVGEGEVMVTDTPAGGTLEVQLDARRLLHGFSEAVLVVDVETLAIRAANPCSEETTGYAMHDLVGSELALLCPTEKLPRLEPVSPAALVAQPGLHDEVPLRRGDGSVFIAAVHVSLADDGGRPVAILFLRDTSERRKLERELITKHVALREAYEELDVSHAELAGANQALDQRAAALARANEELDQRNEELARANEEIRTAQRWLAQLEKMATIGRFAAGVAHEVNNPMAFILENLQRLQDYAAQILPVLRSHLEGPAPTVVRREALSDIVAELESILDESLEGANRVSGIVRQLHSFSNVGEQEAEWTDLREVVESAIMMVKNQIHQRARLERLYYDAPRVAGVPGQLGQVLVNLLVNAIHAISEGDVEANCLLVRIRPVGERSVALEVQDTGCGIPPENLSRIMEPFFSTKPSGMGTGLGLAISTNIVEQHGGRIEVESEVGRGTLMRIILPVEGTLKVRRASAINPAVVPAGRLRLLLVDDELFLLRALKRNLGKDHEVRVASSAAQALEVLAENPDVDLVIADLMMPDGDGVELYDRVVVAHPHLRSRFMFMTGGVFTDRVRAFVERANLAVLAKPIKREDLQQAIAAFGRGRGG